MTKSNNKSSELKQTEKVLHFNNKLNNKTRSIVNIFNF